MRWDPRDVIAAKRDGAALAPSDVERFVRGVGAGEIGDGPAAAFLMAVVLRGLDAEETLAMTRAMIASGETISFDGLAAPTVDKHSTGGVADGVTLLFAPLAAAVGLAVAKLSGRGLGHTGGTLDKLEAIPGVRTDLTPSQIEQQVRDVGCAIAAQSASLVPADGALYALRDATATVPSIPLIAASVMSKKLAVQTDLVLLDIKVGSGAFMRTEGEARELAETCLVLARGAGRPCGVAVTDMSQPLGDAIGNALDIAETVAVLRGEQRGRLRELALFLVAKALEHLDGVAFEEACSRAERAFDDGSALDRFRAMIEAQGGDPRAVDEPARFLPAAPFTAPITLGRAGIVTGMRADALGRASGALGAGRARKGDTIDPAVGIVLRVKIGDRVAEDDVVGHVHARSGSDAVEALRRTRDAVTVDAGSSVEPPALIHAWFAPGEA